MAWLTKEEFEDLYVAGSVHEVPPTQIEECLESAKAEILKLCGDINTEIADGGGDAVRLSIIRRAQRKLAYAEFLDLATSRTRSGGLMRKENDDSNGAVNEYESVSDVLKRKAALRSEAIESLAPYMLPVEAVVKESSYSASVPIEFSW